MWTRYVKMMKNGIFFIVIALLVAEELNILIYANKMSCDITMWTRCVITKN